MIALDAKALIHNLDIAKKNSLNCEVLAIIKSNAYGHGLLRIAKILSTKKVKFGVATLSEAICLRNAGHKEQILLLNGAYWLNNVGSLLEYNITPVIGSIEEFKTLFNWIRQYKLKNSIKIHINIDTGIGRVGFVAQKKNKLNQDLKKIASQSKIEIEGVSTHFSWADNKNLSYTKMQIDRFADVLNMIDKNGIKYDVIHMANSASILRGLARGDCRFAEFFNQKKFWIRPGLMLFGISPIPEELLILKNQMQPVLSLTAKITSLRKLNKNENIGYWATFKTNIDTWIATLPVGYGDGVPFILSNKAYVLINREKAPIVGRVSMNLITVDVTNIINNYGLQSCKPGANAVLIGKQGNQIISATSWATQTGNIVYEIFTNLSSTL